MTRLQDFRTKTRLERIASLRTLGGIVIFLANALSSYLFFVEYGSLAFNRFGQGAALVAGLWGFLMVDVAYVFWRRMRMNDAETVAQVTTATAMFAILFCVSVCISALYFGIFSLQVLFVVSADTMWYLNLFAMLFLTIPVIVNIVGFFFYITNSKEAQQLMKLAEVRQLQANAELNEYEIRAEQSVANREAALQDYRQPYLEDDDRRYREQLASGVHIIPNTPRQAIPRVAASEQPNRMNGIQGGGENERRRGNDPK